MPSKMLFMRPVKCASWNNYCLEIRAMKKAVFFCICLATLALQAKANTYSFTPTPGNLGNLDHNYFYTWGLNLALPQGEKITSATLSFTKIWDWKVETDALFIHLLDTAPLGVNTWTDNEGGGDFFISPSFKSLGIAETKIGQWSDPYGGTASKAQNVTFTFSLAQLTALQGYISNATPSGWAQFAFGFDPDCHYYNSGVQFTITTTKLSVPETGSTMLLMGVALGSLVLIRRRLHA